MATYAAVTRMHKILFLQTKYQAARMFGRRKCALHLATWLSIWAERERSGERAEMAAQNTAQKFKYQASKAKYASWPNTELSNSTQRLNSTSMYGRRC